MAFPAEWGHRPVEMPLVVVRGQDFTQTMNIAPVDSIPTGTTARIEIVDNKKSLVTTWVGWTEPLQIYFAVESEEVDELPKRGLSYYLYIVYPTEPDLDFCLTYGSIEQL